ncbi:IPTL-CTERM sorting domain-containing protein [Ramlibacter sp. H39-3-26]|uniref:IPTL-CTERM sorting domain-containing protein n=1 Tax=Curvibacter soli TaxID=3031331 RepID=UPI0023DB0565|nr:IPTL-CTERM sorting domain-containing protein [Ramlibacter sp. H39-3-26]MDF1485602.1 IPTL-CTERM sorting domain-containing protein [Ramlibacter sp. H39-3-26]
MLRTFLSRFAGVAMAFTLCAHAAAQTVVPVGATFDVPAGAVWDNGCTPLDMQGTLNLNGGTMSVDGAVTFAATGSMPSLGGTLSVGSDLVLNGPLDAGNNTIVMRDGCDPGNTSQITGTLVVQNLTLQSTTGRTFVLPAGVNITVLGTLTIQGTPGQNVQLQSASGTAVIQLGPGATVVRNFASVPPTVQIGAASASLTAIPTLGQYGLALLSMLIGAIAFWQKRASGGHRGRHRSV